MVGRPLAERELRHLHGLQIHRPSLSRMEGLARLVRTSTSGAMGRDALTKTHPIMAKVHDPEEIEELFDEISYGKGASILRMIEAYIGPENFKNGVRQYLEKFRYGNASGHDLWSSLQEASGTDVSRI